MTDALLPLRIRGAVADYVVEIVDRVDDQDSAGEHDSLASPATIKVKAALPPHWRWQTFWHELIHMLEEESLVDLTEDEVERLAIGLYACWKRNGWVPPGARQP